MTSRLVPVIAVLATVALAAQQPPTPPQAPEQAPLTFRVEVNYVEVDAVVTDAQGNLVTDLTLDDFEVIEDRQPQKVTNFSLVNIPIERAERPLFASAPIEPDVQTNLMGEGRLYLIVLDSLHTAPINALKVRAVMRQFIERSFGINDLAAVVFTGGQSNDTQDFTNNPRLLISAIEKFNGLKTAGATLALSEQARSRIGRLPGDPISDPFEFERAFQARNAMDRIRELSTFMAGVRGRRKAMLFVGEGLEYDFYDLINNTQATGVLESSRDAIAAATRANVAIYAIDPRGLTNPEADLIGLPNSPGADDRSLGDLGSRSAAREFLRSQDSLRTLSDETGGFAVVNQNDLTNAFDRIVRDNSAYYVLGYYPTNERRDGRFRTISVRVKRPGLMVRARRGYVAPRGRAPGAPPPPAVTPAAMLTAAANEAVGSPVPVSGIPLRVAAAAFRGTAPNAMVALAIEFRINDFTFTETGGNFTDRVEVVFTPTDRDGKARGGDRHAITMNMKPDTLVRARDRGFRLVSQLELPPGRYQLRVGTAEEGGRVGSVLYDLEIPDFTAAPLTMSGVAITSTLATETPTVVPKNALGQFLPGPVIATREFARDDELALFAEFYENTPNAPAHTLDIVTTVRSEDGRVVHENREERQSGELQGGRGGYGYEVRIPLSEIGPGTFVIHVEGRSRIGDRDNGVGRDILIRVR